MLTRQLHEIIERLMFEKKKKWRKGEIQRK